jgi:hypothetical protein
MPDEAPAARDRLVSDDDVETVVHLRVRPQDSSNHNLCSMQERVKIEAAGRERFFRWSRPNESG